MPLLQRRPHSSARLFHAALTWLAVSAIPTVAQELRLQEPQSQSAPSEGPSLLNEIGKLLKSPTDLLPSFSKPDAPPPPETAQQPPPVAPPTSVRPVAPTSAAIAPSPSAPEPPATVSTRLFPGMVSGREVCPRTANGAPDCQAGIDKLCQSKGYKSGKSLNMDSAFTCSPRQARADGRKPCGTEHFVTSAFCS